MTIWARRPVGIVLATSSIAGQGGKGVRIDRRIADSEARPQTGEIVSIIPSFARWIEDTALHHGRAVLTSNVKQLRPIPGLMVIEA